MTGIATGNVLDRAHLVGFLERIAERGLVVVSRTGKNHRILSQRVVDRLLIAHIENLFARAQVFFRIAMAVEAELHLQRCVLISKWHLIDGTVAGITADTFVYVDAVIEIYKVGQLVDPRPLERAPCAIAFTDRLQISGVGPDLRVAVHAGLGGWNACEARSFNRGVTVTAIDAKSRYMVLVAKRNRLVFPDSSIRNVWCTFQLQQNPE